MHPPRLEIGNQGGKVRSLNATKIERYLITKVLTKLDEISRIKLLSGIRCRTRLQEVMKDVLSQTFKAQDLMPDLKTIRRWINHFIKFGETPTETRKYRTRTGRRTWTPSDIEKLLAIVGKEPDLYLDEIRDRLITQTGKTFHTSSIFKTLRPVSMVSQK